MTAHYKVEGYWKSLKPYVNIAGLYKVPKSSWVKVGDQWKSWFLQGGIIDLGFFVNNSATPGVVTMARQTDGKVIICGNFTSWNGVSVNRVVRINLDGTLDSSFINNIGTGASDNIIVVGLQSDGKIILRASTQLTDKMSFNGSAVNSLLRLNSDGTRDTIFDSNIGGIGADSDLGTVISAIQLDNKILVFGFHTSWNGILVSRLIRLNANGTIDNTFSCDVGSSGINEILITPDSKVVLAGNLVTINSTTTNQVVRINLDGTLDNSFNLNMGTKANGTARAATLQSDGKIVVTGTFTIYNGITSNRIIRFNNDGTIDTAFSSTTGLGMSQNTFATVKVQDDGKIVITGNFTTFNGVSVPRIVRLNSNGSIDTAFLSNVGTGFNNISSAAMIMMPDKKMLIGANFATFNGSTQYGLVRIGGEVAL